MTTRHGLALALLLAPCSSATPDPLRVNQPLIPYALEPLRCERHRTRVADARYPSRRRPSSLRALCWAGGSVRASGAGWLRDWALAARDGLGSPEHAAFAHITNETPGVFHSHGGGGTGSIGTLDGAHGVNGWRDGRPAAAGL